MDVSFLYKTRSGLLTILTLFIALYLVERVSHLISILFVYFSVVAFLFVRNIYSYWEREGLPFIRGSFPLGFAKDVLLQRKSFTETLFDLYEKAGDNKYVGIFSFFQPQIIIKDVDLVKQVLVKDFSNFVDRGVYVNPKDDPLTNNMFSLEGQPWRNLRAKISPTFSSAKLKTMFPTVKNVANDLLDYTAKVQSTKEIINIKDLTGRYGLDVISSVALGLEGNNFKEDHTEMRRITDIFMAPSGVQVVRSVVNFLCRDIAKLFRMRLTSKDVEDYFFQITKSTIKYRKENNIQRNDFMHLLMGLGEDAKQSNGVSENNKDQFKLSLSEMAAQSFVFVIAGYETTSVTMGFLLYELALNPDVQEKLIAELDSIGPDVQYEELPKLPYLEMVLCETLRKHTPLTILQRVCAKDYSLPDGKIIKSGTVCIIPVLAMHRDPKLFPNPEKFDPERFNKENIKNIKPYSYIPFGEGPRICIGNRFAMMQLKLAVAAILSRFKVHISEKTPVPFKFEKKTFLYNSEGGLWLRLIDRNRQMI